MGAQLPLTIMLCALLGSAAEQVLPSVCHHRSTDVVHARQLLPAVIALSHVILVQQHLTALGAPDLAFDNALPRDIFLNTIQGRFLQLELVF